MSNTSRTSERTRGVDSRDKIVSAIGWGILITGVAAAISGLAGACNPETPAPDGPPSAPAPPEQLGHATGVIDGAPLVVSAEAFNASPVAAAAHLAVGHA